MIDDPELPGARLSQHLPAQPLHEFLLRQEAFDPVAGMRPKSSQKPKALPRRVKLKSNHFSEVTNSLPLKSPVVIRVITALGKYSSLPSLDVKGCLLAT